MIVFSKSSFNLFKRDLVSAMSKKAMDFNGQYYYELDEEITLRRSFLKTFNRMVKIYGEVVN